MVTKHEIPRVFFHFSQKWTKKMSKKANPKKVLGKKLRKSTFQNINQKTYLKTPTMGDRLAHLKFKNRYLSAFMVLIIHLLFRRLFF